MGRDRTWTLGGGLLTDVVATSVAPVSLPAGKEIIRARRLSRRRSPLRLAARLAVGTFVLLMALFVNLMFLILVMALLLYPKWHDLFEATMVCQGSPGDRRIQWTSHGLEAVAPAQRDFVPWTEVIVVETRKAFVVMGDLGEFCVMKADLGPEEATSIEVFLAMHGLPTKTGRGSAVWRFGELPSRTDREGSGQPHSSLEDEARGRVVLYEQKGRHARAAGFVLFGAAGTAAVPFIFALPFVPLLGWGILVDPVGAAGVLFALALVYWWWAAARILHRLRWPIKAPFSLRVDMDEKQIVVRIGTSRRFYHLAALEHWQSDDSGILLTFQGGKRRIRFETKPQSASTPKPLDDSYQDPLIGADSSLDDVGPATAADPARAGPGLFGTSAAPSERETKSAPGLTLSQQETVESTNIQVLSRMVRRFEPEARKKYWRQKLNIGFILVVVAFVLGILGSPSLGVSGTVFFLLFVFFGSRTYHKARVANFPPAIEGRLSQHGIQSKDYMGCVEYFWPDCRVYRDKDHFFFLQAHGMIWIEMDSLSDHAIRAIEAWLEMHAETKRVDPRRGWKFWHMGEDPVIRSDLTEGAE